MRPFAYCVGLFLFLFTAVRVSGRKVSLSVRARSRATSSEQRLPAAQPPAGRGRAGAPRGDLRGELPERFSSSAGSWWAKSEPPRSPGRQLAFCCRDAHVPRSCKPRREATKQGSAGAGTAGSGFPFLSPPCGGKGASCLPPTHPVRASHVPHEAQAMAVCIRAYPRVQMT